MTAPRLRDAPENAAEPSRTVPAQAVNAALTVLAAFSHCLALTPSASPSMRALFTALCVAAVLGGVACRPGGEAHLHHCQQRRRLRRRPLPRQRRRLRRGVATAYCRSREFDKAAVVPQGRPRRDHRRGPGQRRLPRRRLRRIRRHRVHALTVLSAPASVPPTVCARLQRAKLPSSRPSRTGLFRCFAGAGPFVHRGRDDFVHHAARRAIVPLDSNPAVTDRGARRRMAVAMVRTIPDPYADRRGGVVAASRR